jgi:hypothetical protein
MRVLLGDIEYDTDVAIEMEADDVSVMFERESQGITQDKYTSEQGGGMACVGVERDCLSVSFYDNSSEDPAVRVWFNIETRRWVAEIQST